jgi:hypothetical protein
MYGKFSRLFFLLAICFPYSSTMKMEAVHSSVTSANLNQTAWRYVTEDIYVYWQIVCLLFDDTLSTENRGR